MNGHAAYNNHLLFIVARSQVVQRRADVFAIVIRFPSRDRVRSLHANLMNYIHLKNRIKNIVNPNESTESNMRLVNVFLFLLSTARLVNSDHVVHTASCPVMDD